MAQASGMRPILAGRDELKLMNLAEPLGLEYRSIEHTAEALKEAFEGASLVVNCVGPYSQFGTETADAAVMCGADYVDFNGEPRFFQYLLEQLDAKAQDSGSVLVPSAGLGACSGLAAAIATRNFQTVDRITVNYQPAAIKASTGTARSLVDIVTGGAPVFRRGTLSFVRFGRRLSKGPSGLSISFPLTDPLALSRMWPTADLKSTQTLPFALLIWLASPLLLIAKLKPVARYLKRRQSRISGADSQDAGGDIKITVQATSGLKTATVTMHIQNMYDQTIRGGFVAITQLLNKTWPAGVRAFGELIEDPEEVLQEMGASVVCD